MMMMRSSLLLAACLWTDLATAQPGGAQCEICGCNACTPTGTFAVGNLDGKLDVTQEIIDSLGDMTLPGGGASIVTQLAGFGITAGSTVPCSFLNDIANSGALPAAACVDGLRLNPTFRETCGCPPVPGGATTPAPVMATATTPTTAAPIDLGVNTLNLPVLTLHGAEGTITDADLPLPKCHGDCNRNTDCDGNLMCFSRGGATTIPGCFGRADADGTDYCWDPNDKPVPGVIAHVGNNGNPPQLFPLQRCTGQCASDADCATGLICLVRDRDTDPVYGCEGPLVDRTDYCVDPADMPGGSGGSTGGNVTTPVGTTGTTPSPTPGGTDVSAATPAPSGGNFTSGNFTTTTNGTSMAPSTAPPTTLNPTSRPVPKGAAKPPPASAGYNVVNAATVLVLAMVATVTGLVVVV
jgi:hypothetical protein